MELIFIMVGAALPATTLTASAAVFFATLGFVVPNSFGLTATPVQFLSNCPNLAITDVPDPLELCPISGGKADISY